MYDYNENRLTRNERMKKQEEEIYLIIKNYIEKNKYAPSILEIAKKSSVTSKSTVFNYMQKLKAKGLIDWQPKIPRSIILTNLQDLDVDVSKK